MSQEINFSDLNEVQKEQYIKYILENNIPLHEDSSKKEIVAEIKLHTSQKKIIQKYVSLKNDQMNTDQSQSPIKKYEQQREYQSNINLNKNGNKSKLLYQSTPNNLKQHDNKENENKGRQVSKSPNQNQRSSSPLFAQPLSKNSSSIKITQRRLFNEEESCKQNKTPKKQETIPSSILKEVNHNVKDGMSLSDNKITLRQKSALKNIEEKQTLINSKQKGNDEQYIPSTLRKKSIRDEQSEKETKRSISSKQQKSRSTSQYEIFSAIGAFPQQQNKVNLISSQGKNKRNTSTNRKGLNLETNQDPFNLTLSTIKSKETNSKFTNFTPECSLFNKTSKSGNILVVDNSGSDNHSQSTSSSSSNSYWQQQNTQTSSSYQNQSSKPYAKNKMNEIYDVLKSVGFCPNNTNGSEWQSVVGGEMRSDPQELSVKFDTRNLFIDSIQGDDTCENKFRKRTPSPNMPQKYGYQSDYLKILSSQENQRSPQNQKSISPVRFNRGRNTSNNDQPSPSRKKSIPSIIATPTKGQHLSISPHQQVQREKSSGYNQDGYNSNTNKDYRIKSSIMSLFKNKFGRLTKIPLAPIHSQIEEIYAAKEALIQKQQTKYSSKKSNSFKEFVYDFYLKKFKNNQKIAEHSLFNFIGSLEFHSENSDSLISKQFLQMVNDEYSEEQINFYLLAFSEIQFNFKQKSIQYLHLSEKTVFKISLKLFNTPQDQPLCYEIIQQVSQQESYLKSQTIASYHYLEILMQAFKLPLFRNKIDYKQNENQNTNNQAKEQKRRNSQSSHSSPFNNHQKPFSMVNESFGIQAEVNNALNANKEGFNNMCRTNSKEKIDDLKKQNNIKSILQNKDYQSEVITQSIAKQTDFFFSNQYEDLKLSQSQPQSSISTIQKYCKDKNIISQSCPVNITQIQLIQTALFTEMERIVIEFVQMFEVQNKQSAKKLEELILKKCKYLITSLILKEQNKWFELLLIDYPNYQQKMQAETIQKLYDAYEISFIQNNKSSNENKNLRSLCKLILKVPELNDAISKLLICVLVPESS